jgi:16S rRNA (guanine527-N7)-methyltransferase
MNLAANKAQVDFPFAEAEARLNDGLVSLGITLEQEKITALLDYLALLQKWNKIHNLTAVRDVMEMVTLHLLDSLAVLPHIKGDRLLDVGSGAGLPGIPLAICLPALQVTTIDASQKKASFMRQAKGVLGLNNLTVASGRVEQLDPSEKFDLVISRAFSDIALFIKLTKRLLLPDGHWLAMKGLYPADELRDARVTPSAVIRLQVPGLNAERHLLFIQNTQFGAH